MFEGVKFKLVECLKCGEKMMAPVALIKDDDGRLVEAEMEYVHKCECDLKELDDSWTVFPSLNNPLIAFRVKE